MTFFNKIFQLQCFTATLYCSFDIFWPMCFYENHVDDGSDDCTNMRYNKWNPGPRPIVIALPLNLNKIRIRITKKSLKKGLPENFRSPSYNAGEQSWWEISCRIYRKSTVEIKTNSQSYDQESQIKAHKPKWDVAVSSVDYSIGTYKQYRWYN